MSSAKRIVGDVEVCSGTSGLTAHATIKTSHLVDALEQNPDVTDVVILAILGPARKGKSFLLNLIALYLEHLMFGKETSHWLEWNRKVKGLHWKQSRSSVTEGIWLWNKSYILPLAGSKKVKVLLMDCQGSQDKGVVDQSLDIDAITNAIGIKLSTIQLFNISGTLDANHIQTLENVTNYMKEVSKCLMVVQRNWTEDDEMGHVKLVKELMEHEAIGKKFKRISAFRLAVPGASIQTSSFSVGHRLSELYRSEDNSHFLDGVDQLCQLLFSDIDPEVVKSSQEIVTALNEIEAKFQRNFRPIHFAPPTERLKLDMAMTKLDSLREQYRQKISNVDQNKFKDKDELDAHLKELCAEALGVVDDLKSQIGVSEREASLAEEFEQQTRTLDIDLHSAARAKLADSDPTLADSDPTLSEDKGIFEKMHEAPVALKIWCNEHIVTNWLFRFILGIFFKLLFPRVLAQLYGQVLSHLLHLSSMFMFVGLLMIASYSIAFALIVMVCFGFIMHSAFNEGMQYQTRAMQMKHTKAA